MTGVSTCVLLGTLAEPLEVLQTKNGKPWIRALLSVKTFRRAADGEPGQEEETTIPVNFFSKPAEIAQKYLTVGGPVAVTVRLSGTAYSNGGTLKRGVSLTADQLHLIPNGRKQDRGYHERSH